MNIDQLSRLPVDVFIQQITYLPFDEVINVCKANTTLHNYCTNPDYNNNWRKLIDDTFGNILNYQEKLKQIRNKLNINEGVYNYLVYSHLVKLLDPITQLMIYYRQGDMKLFHDFKYNNTQRFLALFLLGNVKEMRKYLPSDDLPFISMLEGQKISRGKLDRMLAQMAKEGSVKGVSMMLSEGADIHADNDHALKWASGKGHLEVVKYLTEEGANIRDSNDQALRGASQKGHLEIVKYLIEKGANIHANNDEALRLASQVGHLDTVKYLVDHGANVHAINNLALRWASKFGHLEVVRYLIEHGADIHAEDDLALRWASESGHLEVVKYLAEHSADIHTNNDWALIVASGKGHLEVVKYLIEHGADVHAENDDALKEAREWGHLDVVKYLESVSNKIS